MKFGQMEFSCDFKADNFVNLNVKASFWKIFRTLAQGDSLATIICFIR
jgi:hypothetical protein